MNGEKRIITSWIGYLILILVVFVGIFPPHARCQNKPPSRKPKPRLSPLISNLFLGRFNKTVEQYQPEIEREIGFCTTDVKKDFHGAFDFEGREQFFQNCQDKLKDLPARLCTVSELRVYFTSFLTHAGEKKSVSQSHFLGPNRNCNLTSWSAGCEAGWASTVNPGQKYDYNETDPKKMPFRTSDSKPCCEGFFCPQGLTCMIPCPLGAHCPVAKLNPTSGICLPYHYQLPSGQKNYTCGAADMWVPVHLGNEIFCDAGYYCPTTIKKIQCPRGCYCRMGSRVKYRCFPGTKCDKGTEIPSMKVYGILLIALLTAILIVVYNCSDQVISTRYEKQAKSREEAAKYAREIQARQKSRAAKDASGWKPSGLQGIHQTLSRKFSRTKTKGSSALPPSGPLGNKKEIRSLDDNAESDKGANLENGDKSSKHERKASKELHTRSQIFKYAYGQIEKEKAMEEMNMYMSDVDVLRKRPRIEVAFKELTLTLKGKNRNIMRNVSGKILPGRISAVMGPSGAGKTTFLSALTGKISGCTMSGMILINGKNELIHSYKKIVGFVPQDDIVHGDLTVEENLRFSARCRLSADLPKADKVLITERVIEALGLQGVRDSKVGTVEKRGISGGQKKRVNVGLEMVMEPSLLILDEPTSGLDSASSSLLLRALRREAMEGVNISMVVHQPSYSLYKMFDDLILLAKGGLTVYHGPVDKVEEYFEGLGITIPERVNTPDHLIDILEGIIKPGGNVTAQQLPVRWMLHNGYRVPPDMLHLCDQSTTASPPSLEASIKDQRDVEKYNYFRTPDLSGRVTPGVFSQYKYYLGRVAKQRMRDARVQAADYLILLLAGACLGTMAEVSDVSFGYSGYQYTVIAVSLLCMIGALRTFSQDKLQYKRESASGMNSLSYFMAKDTMDLLNIVMKPLVYLCMFYFFSYPRSSFVSNYIILLCLVYCVTGISYTLAISLEFSQAQLVVTKRLDRNKSWPSDEFDSRAVIEFLRKFEFSMISTPWVEIIRELKFVKEPGNSITALGSNSSDGHDLLRSNNPFWSVLLPVVLTLVANQDKKSFASLIAKFVFPRWALEAFVVANSKEYNGVWLLTRCAALKKFDFDIHNSKKCLWYLLGTGVGCRVIAFIFLLTRSK